jgi:hypothetical protein
MSPVRAVRIEAVMVAGCWSFPAFYRARDDGEMKDAPRHDPGE